MKLAKTQHTQPKESDRANEIAEDTKASPYEIIPMDKPKRSGSAAKRLLAEDQKGSKKVYQSLDGGIKNNGIRPAARRPWP